jgi:hypothetical protein
LLLFIHSHAYMLASFLFIVEASLTLCINIFVSFVLLKMTEQTGGHVSSHGVKT